MKTTAILALTLCSAFSAGAMAQSDGMHGMDMKHDEAAAQSHKAAGVVKSVNAAKGSVTIAHGAIQSLNWPAMTMTFKAKDPMVLQHAKPGANVQFSFVQSGKDYVITEIR